MNNIRGNSRRIVTWLIGAALTFGPVAFMSSALAAQTQDQSNQQAEPAPGAPPPDAQQPDNGQPPPPSYAGNGQQQPDNGQAPPPPPYAGNGQPDNGQAPPPADSQDQSGQPGQWGPAGPPPDAQNGQVPQQPQDQDQGPSQYPGQPQDQGQGGYGAGTPYPNGAQPILPRTPVTIPNGTLLQIRTSERLDTKKLHVGDPFPGTLARGVFLGNMLVVPRGAQVVGRVVDLRKPGDLKGSAKLALQVASLDMSGQSYPLATNVWSVKSAGKGGYTASNAIGGAFLGSVIGAIAGGGPGAAIGAAAGTGVGLGASAASPGPRNIIPAESVLTFRLTAPVTVDPITYQEVQEIEQSAPPPPQPRYPVRYGYPPPPGYYGGYPPPPPPVYPY